MTKRIAAVAVALGLALQFVPEHVRAPESGVPLDIAYHFCACSDPGHGYFHRAPIRINHRPNRQEWT